MNTKITIRRLLAGMFASVFLLASLTACATEIDPVVDTTDDSVSTDVTEDEDVEEEPEEEVEEQPEVEEEPEVESTVGEAVEASVGSGKVVNYVDTSVDWNLILVNPWNALPDDFTVETASLSNGLLVDARILDDLNEMLADAKAAGHSVTVCSAYRTMEKQTSLFTATVNKWINMGYETAEATVLAATSSAYPGTSEHQAGLAVDIVAVDYQILDSAQADQEEQQWLMEHCYEYGFILRYEEDTIDITGIIYEPWHYRYVGVEVALEIRDLGITFEEYYELMGL